MPPEKIDSLADDVNGFRSDWGAKVYADLCSIVATGRLAGRSALAAIRDALAAPTPERAAAWSSG
jgi:hypothetical protein